MLPECANNTISHQLLKVHQTNFNRKPFKEYCQAKQATRTVAERCHTQSNCSLQAQFDQFPLPDCANELTNDEKQTQVHLKVTYACVQNEVLRTSLISSSNTLANSISNMISTTAVERKTHRPQNKTKDAMMSTLNELSTQSQSTQSNSVVAHRPELTDLLTDNNLPPATEFNANNRNIFYDHPNENVHPTDNDNLPAAAVRSNNEQSSSWPNNQINELPTDFKTHISNQSKSIEPFKDWSSFCQYIESE